MWLTEAGAQRWVVISYDDAIQPGVFARTLLKQGSTRVTLRGDDTDRVIGVGGFVEDAYGLLGKYRFVASVRDSDETLASSRPAQSRDQHRMPSPKAERASTNAALGDVHDAGRRDSHPGLLAPPRPLAWHGFESPRGATRVLAGARFV